MPNLTHDVWRLICEQVCFLQPSSKVYAIISPSMLLEQLYQESPSALCSVSLVSQHLYYLTLPLRYRSICLCSQLLSCLNKKGDVCHETVRAKIASYTYDVVIASPVSAESLNNLLPFMMKLKYIR